MKMRKTAWSISKWPCFIIPCSLNRCLEKSIGSLPLTFLTFSGGPGARFSMKEKYGFIFILLSFFNNDRVLKLFNLIETTFQKTI